MKTNNLIVIVICFVWVLFIIWELFVTKWKHSINENTFRIDIIIILPLIQFITTYTLVKTYKYTQKNR